MPKVKFPLFSNDASGAFGKRLIFRRGGVVTRYFVPKDPKSAAQVAHREQFRSYWMAGLTQAVADLLYAALNHLHAGVYAEVGHEHHHDEMLGLGDDDHENYFNQTRGDARYLRRDLAVIAGATSALTLTTSYQDIEGMSLTLPAGKWAVAAFIDARVGAANTLILGQLVVGSIAQTRPIVCRASAGAYWVTVGQQWLITLANQTVVKLQGNAVGTMTPASVIQTNSTLMAWPV